MGRYRDSPLGLTIALPSRHHAHLTAFSDDHILPTEQITIRTTSDRVCWSFVCENDIYVGKVLYVDYERADIGIENLLTLYQQRSFEHEREVRAMIYVAQARWPCGGISPCLAVVACGAAPTGGRCSPRPGLAWY